MTDADNWPTHAEELGRKTLTTLEDQMRRHDEGKITLLELYLIVGALYDTVAGLLPTADADIVTTVHQNLRMELQRLRREGNLAKAVRRG